MRRIKNVIALSMGALLWAGAGAWAQHAPGSVPQSTQSSGMQSPASQPQSTSATDKPGKPKKWSGKLVDAPCMMKALNTFAASTQQNASPDVPHFLGGPSEPVQYAGGGAQQPQMPGGQGRQQSPNMPVGQQGQNPNMGPNETAQMQGAAMIDNAAKQCAATPSTTSFGLALGDGQVIKFDGDGDSKASQAVKDVELEPGKAVKATIKGIDQGSGSVQVASVEIKHKGKGKHAT
jgi:hypothetical protein